MRGPPSDTRVAVSASCRGHCHSGTVRSAKREAVRDPVPVMAAVGTSAPRLAASSSSNSRLTTLFAFWGRPSMIVLMVLARPWRMAVGGAPPRLAGRAEHRLCVHRHCGAPAAKGALHGRAAWQALGRTAPRMVHGCDEHCACHALLCALHNDLVSVPIRWEYCGQRSSALQGHNQLSCRAAQPAFDLPRQHSFSTIKQGLIG